MGGQTLEAYEATAVDIAVEDLDAVLFDSPANTLIMEGDSSNIGEAEISDPIAAFLQKHGSKYTKGHNGQLVTYYEAVELCPALGALIRTMGDATLALTAAEHPQTETENFDLEPEGDVLFKKDNTTDESQPEKIAKMLIEEQKNTVLPATKENARETANKELRHTTKTGLTILAHHISTPSIESITSIQPVTKSGVISQPVAKATQKISSRPSETPVQITTQPGSETHVTQAAADKTPAASAPIIDKTINTSESITPVSAAQLSEAILPQDDHIEPGSVEAQQTGDGVIPQSFQIETITIASSPTPESIAIEDLAHETHEQELNPVIKFDNREPEEIILTDEILAEPGHNSLVQVETMSPTEENEIIVTNNTKAAFAESPMPTPLQELTERVLQRQKVAAEIETPRSSLKLLTDMAKSLGDNKTSTAMELIKAITVKVEASEIKLDASIDPKQPEKPTQESKAETNEPEAEVVKLLAELFDVAGIDYTPESLKKYAASLFTANTKHRTIYKKSAKTARQIQQGSDITSRPVIPISYTATIPERIYTLGSKIVEFYNRSFKRAGGQKKQFLSPT